jgi:hypothetical protein
LRKLWLLNAALRMGLHKLAPALFSPPAFQMVQNYDLKYQEVSNGTCAHTVCNTETRVWQQQN